MSSTTRILGDLERRAFRAAFTGELLRILFVGSLVLGTVGLLLRVAFDIPASEAAWVLSGLGFAPGLAFWRAWSRKPARAALVSWLDAQAGGDGALVTAHEEPDARWSSRADERAERVRLPSMHIGPEGLRLLCGAAFALVALLVPLQRAQLPGPPTGLFDSTLERLGERLDLLREFGLDEGAGKEMSERLSDVAEEIASGGSETGFEALDRLNERLGGEGERLAESLGNLGASLAAQTDPGALGELLSQTLRELKGSSLLEQLPEDLQSLVAAGQMLEAAGLSPARALELSAGLRELFGKRLLDLADAGLIAPGRLESALEAMRAIVVEHDCEEEDCEPGGT